ncbi:MAG: ribose-5-phosphate isomerase RpiA [Cyanobacteria bacterium HKST-UBA01]|nr:ribose-5-phosphate isomerase RpiA [Cyanobacteria bacterium HKST-UBA01]
MTVDQEKFSAAKRAVDFIENEMIIGLGSGSTVKHALSILAEKVKSGLKIKGIPTSMETASMSLELGIPLTTLEDNTQCDLTIDGADEFDRDLNLIKGGGGALLREKIVASASSELIIIVDSSKQVDCLGRFPLPIEVIKFALPVVMNKLHQMNASPNLRKLSSGTPYITDENNYIIDCNFGALENTLQIQNELEEIPGIVEHGLFLNYADKVIVGIGNSTKVIEAKSYKSTTACTQSK